MRHRRHAILCNLCFYVVKVGEVANVGQSFYVGEVVVVVEDDITLLCGDS
ncbi:MAG: hypothetical protein R3E39_31345 [Anaerolineae bacterium]